MSTGSQLIDRLRTYLQEAVANEWDPAQLLRYVNDARQDVGFMLSEIDDSGWFRYTESISIPAQTETFDLTTLTHTLYGIDMLWHLQYDQYYMPCEKIPTSEQQGYRNPTNYESVAELTPGYYVDRPIGSAVLHALPIATGARTFLIAYRIEVPTITTGQESTIPARYDELVCRLAMRQALTDENEVNEENERRIPQLENQLLDLEAESAQKARPKRIRAELSGTLFGDGGVARRFFGKR